MVKLIDKCIEKAKNGAFVWIRPTSPEEVILKLELGGIEIIKDNWIIYYGIFPEEEHDIHDCIYSNISEVDRYTISFNDQYSRVINIMSMESFETEEKNRVKNWFDFIDDKFRSDLASIIKDRLENPQYYLGNIQT